MIWPFIFVFVDQPKEKRKKKLMDEFRTSSLDYYASDILCYAFNYYYFSLILVGG